MKYTFSFIGENYEENETYSVNLSIGKLKQFEMENKFMFETQNFLPGKFEDK